MSEVSYKILYSKLSHKLSDQVSYHLSNGWEVHGGPGYSSGEEVWFQAVVKRPPSDQSYAIKMWLAAGNELTNFKREHDDGQAT